MTDHELMQVDTNGNGVIQIYILFVINTGRYNQTDVPSG